MNINVSMELENRNSGVEEFPNLFNESENE